MGLRKLLRTLKKFFFKRDSTPERVHREIEKRQWETALNEFFARRGVEWPRIIVKSNNIVTASQLKPSQPWKVKLNNLYPDLSEFY
jgi:hypothetical protein